MQIVEFRHDKNGATSIYIQGINHNSIYIGIGDIYWGVVGKSLTDDAINQSATSLDVKQLEFFKKIVKSLVSTDGHVMLEDEVLELRPSNMIRDQALATLESLTTEK